MECIFLQCRGNGCPCILLQRHGCSQALTWQVVHPTRISPCDLLVFEPRPPRALPGRRRLVSSLHPFVPVLAFAKGAPQQQPICTAVCTGEQTLLGGEEECLGSQAYMSEFKQRSRDASNDILRTAWFCTCFAPAQQNYRCFS